MRTDLEAGVRVDDRHLAARLERNEHVDAEPVERDRARDAGIVVIDAPRVILGARVEIDTGADGPDGVLEVERLIHRGACRA